MVKVVVYGAAGAVGQPLSMLLKVNPLIKELALIDKEYMSGVAADLSQIPTPAKVESYLPTAVNVEKALTGADMVIISVVVKDPSMYGQRREELVKINAKGIRDIAFDIINFCPKAFVLVISDPVNTTVPIIVEVFKRWEKFDAKRVFGVTTLDVARASTFVAEAIGDLSAATEISVPVIGGHNTEFGGSSIVPLLSQSSHPLPANFSKEALEKLTHRVKTAGDEVAEAKDADDLVPYELAHPDPFSGPYAPRPERHDAADAATFSMAYIGAEFVGKVIRAIKGEKGIVATSFVHLSADAEGGKVIQGEVGEYGKYLNYFSTRVELGANGVQRILPIGTVTEYEKKLIEDAVLSLGSDIGQGEMYAILGDFDFDQH